MTYSRCASHANTDGNGWYDAVRSRLADSMREYFGNTQALSSNKSATATDEAGTRVLALIAPHAGIGYCGLTSAEAYAALWRYLYPAAAHSPGSRVRRVFILGPSHCKAFNGVELSNASQYETPFGNIAIDAELVRTLQGAFQKGGVSAALTTQRTDEEEHSIEMQMPFLSYILHTPYKGTAAQAVAPRVSLVPIIVGWADRASEEQMAQVLRQYMADDQNIFIFSSDFCHWGSRFRYTYHYQKDKYPQVGDSIIAMDHAGMDLLEAKNTDGWYNYLKQTGNTICGRHPISVGLQWWTSPRNTASDKTTVEFVGYSQSNTCKTKNDHSVSYAAAVVRQIA